MAQTAPSVVPDPPRNLYQRLQAVATKVGKVAATGKDQFKGKALSIGDVEDAIRDACADEGVITRWSYVSLEPMDKNWLARLRVRLVNADDPDDFSEDEWIDIGGNPMAATSFVRKGYYKALFHITEDEDEKGSTPPPQQRQQAPRPTPPPSAPAATTAAPAAPVDEHRVELGRGLTQAYNAAPREGTVTRGGVLADFGYSPNIPWKDWLVTLTNEQMAAATEALQAITEIPFHD